CARAAFVATGRRVGIGGGIGTRDASLASMDHDVFLERVRRWGGLAQRREADLAIAATTRALREALTDDEAQALTPERSPPLAHIMRSRTTNLRLGSKEFFE